VLSNTDQARAFEIPPAGVRKIVLSTDIAETGKLKLPTFIQQSFDDLIELSFCLLSAGVTIPDVVFVIDSCKVKQTCYKETSRIRGLREVCVSKASANQRAGRAGRVQPGFCFRLITKPLFSKVWQASLCMTASCLCVC
jgi:ATP-dependent RNA helicase DHX29